MRIPAEEQHSACCWEPHSSVTRSAWARSMDACDQVTILKGMHCGLRSWLTVSRSLSYGQQTRIHTVISKLLKALLSRQRASQELPKGGPVQFLRRCKAVATIQSVKYYGVVPSSRLFIDQNGTKGKPTRTTRAKPFTRRLRPPSPQLPHRSPRDPTTTTFGAQKECQLTPSGLREGNRFRIRLVDEKTRPLLICAKKIVRITPLWKQILIFFMETEVFHLQTKVWNIHIDLVPSAGTLARHLIRLAPSEMERNWRINYKSFSRQRLIKNQSSHGDSVLFSKQRHEGASKDNIGSFKERGVTKAAALESQKNMKSEDVGGMLIVNAKYPEAIRTEKVGNLRRWNPMAHGRVGYLVMADLRICDQHESHKSKYSIHPVSEKMYRRP
ncbi:hypothetical protein Tco_0641318 [Tanacetum coccineum]